MSVSDPSQLPAVARALADERLPVSVRATLRQACAADEDRRLAAANALMETAELRLMPAIVALAGLREPPERFVLLVMAGAFEMIRIGDDLEVPEDFQSEHRDACATALAHATAALAAPVDPELLRPLLACIAVFQGDPALSSLILDDPEEGTDDADDEEDDEDDDGRH